MTRRPKGAANPLISPVRRRERWRDCEAYMRRANSLPEARALAKKDGKNYDAAVWITALGRLLESGKPPWAPHREQP